MSEFRFEGIRKAFRSESGEQVEVIRDISFNLPVGTFLTLVGPSGCGKTTFLRIVAGFDAEFEGKILPPGDSPSDARAMQGNVGYIPQEPSLFPWLTVKENVAYGLRVKGAGKEERERVAGDFLQKVGLADFAQYYPKEISGGMKQKVAICRALASNPRHHLIVMDEPFSALDAQTRNALQVEVLAIQRDQGLTILFVTHNYDEAVFLSDQVVVLCSKPASVKKIVPIPYPHPRERTSPAFNKLRKQLMEQGVCPPPVL